ncbi:uncharacterized protein RCC_06078 [Ramularia collo-cygni]|uniref:Piwi domain-containing protein n=1 Tax=Ramularia collo-cygni TaxID=112498 RepID=A0A2D3UUG3_9PEZI|nr:uncharacterized protein RCC_06078 [Ramularia collo-cygni]CZT20221.1 uncharacterized protein RCC_06078 [Ramularia collo-cygni]
MKLLAHGGSTIVVGADVTHPGRGSVQHCPSVAAVVASTDPFAVNYPGSMRLRRSKQEMIADLADMLEERLGVWFQGHKKLPENILFYRDGVSEPQFAMVRDEELLKIQKGCASAGVKHRFSCVQVKDYPCCLRKAPPHSILSTRRGEERPQPVLGN